MAENCHRYQRKARGGRVNCDVLGRVDILLGNFMQQEMVMTSLLST